MPFYLSKGAFLVVIACGLAIPVNTESVKARYYKAGIVDPVEDPQGLLPPTLNGSLIKTSDDDMVGREPTSKAIRLENEANTVVNGYALMPDSLELFADSVNRSFRSGDSVAYQFYKRVQRERLSPPPDPTFNSTDYVARNREKIPQLLESQFHLATSEMEANLILQEMKQELRDREILLRRYGRPAEYRVPIL